MHGRASTSARLARSRRRSRRGGEVEGNLALGLGLGLGLELGLDILLLLHGHVEERDGRRLLVVLGLHLDGENGVLREAGVPVLILKETVVLHVEAKAVLRLEGFEGKAEAGLAEVNGVLRVCVKCKRGIEVEAHLRG